MGTPDTTADTHATTHASAGGTTIWGRLGLWWVASLMVAFLHNGLWATPNLAFMSEIAKNLGDNPFGGGGDYLLTGPLPGVLARLFGQTDPHELARLHLLVLVLGWGLVVGLANQRSGYRVARTLTVLLAAAPLVTVSMQWLGQPDPITGLCGVAMVLVRRKWSLFALAVLAGLSHPEQALFMAAVAGLVRIPLAHLPGARIAAVGPTHTPRVGESVGNSRQPSGSNRGTTTAAWLTLVVALSGVVAGRLITEVYLRVSGIEILNPRTRYLDFGLSQFIDHHTQEPLALLWTLWGPIWLAFAGVGIAVGVQRWLRGGAPPRSTGTAAGETDGARERNRVWLAIAVLGLAALVPVLVTLDETRVYAVITAPLLAAIATAIGTWEGMADRWLMWGSAALLAVTAVIPGGFATGVTAWRPQLDTAAMVEFLASGEQPPEAPLDMTIWLLEPFTFEIPDVGG